ncbi:MAG: M28 family peptidase, partial [Bryobacteraceae bacterium]
MRKFGVLFLAVLPAVAQDHVDLAVVDRIKSEAFDHSQVMDHLYNLTEVNGPRLTGSPEFERAAKWAAERLKGFGVVNPHFEKWGPFGRSWSLQQASVEMIEPRYSLVTAAPLAWSSSTNGAVTGDLILAPLKLSFRDGPTKLRESLDAYKKKWTGKLRGKIVLVSDPKIPKPQSNAQFKRYSAEDLTKIATAPDPAMKIAMKSVDDLKWPEDPEDLGKFFNSLPLSGQDQLWDKIEAITADRGAFFAAEGVTAVLMEDARAHEGMLFAEAAGSYKSKDTPAPATFVITAEQYDRIARGVEKGQPIQVRVGLKATMSDKDVDGMNIVGEIPGGAKKDEIVMIGAHFDSWHTGTGATDNGAG